MLNPLHILLAVVLVALLGTLGLGFYALFKGGNFGRSWSNRLMRLRVLLQFTAVMIICAAYWLSQRH
jgi:drug/metabolite transporter (DMT)-like permease